MSTKDKQIKLIQELAEIVEELGWVIAIPSLKEDELCEGLIIGTKSFVAQTVEVSYEGGLDEADIFAPNTESGDKIPESDPSEDMGYH